MKITTSCSGRFHIYDQARQLEIRGLLHKLISDYPHQISARWGIPKARNLTLLSHGIKSRIARIISPYLNESNRSRLAEILHISFARQVAKKLPSNSDFFIGLSSFSLEPIIRAREMGIKTAVDHGSNHLSFDFEEMQKEAAYWGIKSEIKKNFQWVIDRENREFELADYIFLLSEHAKSTFTSKGFNPDKIFVNPCGVNLDSFYPGTKLDSVFRVLQVGNVGLQKGVLHTMKAFHELALENSELWIVGAKNYGAELEPWIRKFQGSNVRFFDPVPQHKLIKFYQQATVFLMPSISDGFGMVVPQAMACSLPAIVSEHVGAKDLITHGHNGWIVKPRNSQEIKELLLNLYLNQDCISTIGENARKTVKELNGWESYGQRLANFLISTNNGISSLKNSSGSAS
jgi:glycosyltransferase involved in cell wall biosynthesis